MEKVSINCPVDTLEYIPGHTIHRNEILQFYLNVLLVGVVMVMDQNGSAIILIIWFIYPMSVNKNKKNCPSKKITGAFLSSSVGFYLYSIGSNGDFQFEEALKTALRWTCQMAEFSQSWSKDMG